MSSGREVAPAKKSASAKTSGCGLYSSFQEVLAPLPEIAKLRLGDTIPKHAFKTYDLKQLARRLMQWKASTHIDPTTVEPWVNGFRKPRARGFDFDFAKSSRVHIYLPESTIPFLAQRKEILNIHHNYILDSVPQIIQTIQKERAIRQAEVDHRLLGLKIEDPYALNIQNPINSFRPKFGILDMDLPPEAHLQTKGAGRYGEYVAVLKRELLARTSYTDSDSQAYALYAADESLPALVHPVCCANRLYLPEKLSTDYIEAQVWGPIDAGDIEKFLVPKNVSGTTLTHLKKLGVPIFTYDEVVQNGQTRRIESALLYKP